MKKTAIILAIAFAGITATADNSETVSKVSLAETIKKEWAKSKEGTWLGADKTWYKLNTKDASVWSSKDGKKWDAAKDGLWQDKENHWLKIDEKKLKWSADNGKTWAEVPEWKWQGVDGKWYKFEKDWSLLTQN